MLLNELFKLQEKSTQYHYFSDEMLNNIQTDDKIFNFISDWMYTSGPASDERYSLDKTLDDYLELLEPSEIEFLQKAIKRKFNVKESDEKDTSGDKQEKKKSLKTYPVTVGTLVKVVAFGKDNEPRKQMWNKSVGEILTKNKDGSFKIRITCIKDSNILFSKNWYDNESGALRQKLNLRREEFKTLQELENEENE